MHGLDDSHHMISLELVGLGFRVKVSVSGHLLVGTPYYTSIKLCYFTEPVV